MDKYQQLLQNLRQLNLENMAENLPAHTDKVNNQVESFSEALLVLTNQQIEYLQAVEQEKRIQRAHFPIAKRLEEFDYGFQPNINEQRVNDLATMSFVNRHENIVFIGSPGVGKTHLAIGLGVAACEQGVRTLFINCHDLLLKLRRAATKGNLERVIHRYQRYELLIIDEVGYIPFAAHEADLFFQLINGRYERHSTIVTTNVPLSSWGTVFDNPPAAEAILDRLVYQAHIFKIKGRSYRLASAQN